MELRDGFPKTAEELYRYHAIVIDDLEAAFFTQDQLGLLRNFVSTARRRAPDARRPRLVRRRQVRSHACRRTACRFTSTADRGPQLGQHRLVLTREGWLQPWVRTRKTEEEEHKRLAAMPDFQTLSRVGRIKPGAVTLAEVSDDEGHTSPRSFARRSARDMSPRS